VEHVSTHPSQPIPLIIQSIWTTISPSTFQKRTPSENHSAATGGLTLTAIMIPNLPPHLFGGEDFGNEYLHSLNFGVEFDFGSEFSGAYYNADYFVCDIEYDSMSVDCLCDDVDEPATSYSRKKNDDQTDRTEFIWLTGIRL
jgi:hypothetical protein